MPAIKIPHNGVDARSGRIAMTIAGADAGLAPTGAACVASVVPAAGALREAARHAGSARGGMEAAAAAMARPASFAGRPSAFPPRRGHAQNLAMRASSQLSAI